MNTIFESRMSSNSVQEIPERNSVFETLARNIEKFSRTQYICINLSILKKIPLMTKRLLKNKRDTRNDMRAVFVRDTFLSPNPGNGRTIFKFHPVARGAVESHINSEKIARCDEQFDETSS